MPQTSLTSWVLLRLKDEKYVAKGGYELKYTVILDNARLFYSEEEAIAEQGEGERAVLVHALLFPNG